MTRTVCIGKAPDKLRKLYQTVLDAQKKAVVMLQPGISCSDIHNAVVDFFEEQGYETEGTGTEFTYAEGFVHALGHGISQTLHDTPRISPNSPDVLAVGDIVTIEPGLYYKDLGAVRIEDMYLITENGARSLTNFPHVFEI